jgi:hypothetical protein
LFSHDGENISNIKKPEPAHEPMLKEKIKLRLSFKHKDKTKDKSEEDKSQDDTLPPSEDSPKNALHLPENVDASLFAMISLRFSQLFGKKAEKML